MTRVDGARPCTSLRHRVCDPSNSETESGSPFVRERSQRRVMIIAAPSLLVVVRPRPLRKANGLIREFVKGLLDQFRTGQAMVDPEGFAAPFGHGRDARVRLQVGGGLPA